jgi:hypothetical protein
VKLVAEMDGDYDHTTVEGKNLGYYSSNTNPTLNIKSQHLRRKQLAMMSRGK